MMGGGYRSVKQVPVGVIIIFTHLLTLSTVGSRTLTFLDLGSGMDCLKTLFRRQHFQVSGADLNPSSSSIHILFYHLTVHLTL